MGGFQCGFLPPAVTSAANHVMTMDELLEHHHDAEAIDGYTVARGVSENSRGSSF